MTNDELPDRVRLAVERATSAGFTQSCDEDTGRFLATLAAGVPPSGRVLELGTGTGVGTAWIVHGLRDRADVEVLSIEIEPATADLASGIPWPPGVRLVVGDAVEVTRRSGTFDLIFADAPGGKWTGLDTTLAALRSGGHLLVDDTRPGTYIDGHHAQATAEVRNRLRHHPDLVNVEIAWSTGLILCTRRRIPPGKSNAPDR